MRTQIVIAGNGCRNGKHRRALVIQLLITFRIRALGKSLRFRLLITVCKYMTLALHYRTIHVYQAHVVASTTRYTNVLIPQSV